MPVHASFVQPPWPFDDLVDKKRPPNDKGASRSSFMERYSRPCTLISKPATLRYRCTLEGCKWSWAHPRATTRIAEHVAYGCPKVSEEDKAAALNELGGRSLAVKVTSSDSGSRGASSSVSGQTKSIFDAFRTEGNRQRDDKANHLLLLALCDSALPLALVKNPAWRAFFEYMNNSITIRVPSTFSGYVSAEAAHVRKLSIEALQRHYNLTLSFDGGTTRGRQSVYTVHVTTPDTREAHLLEGDEASGVSHTGEHIKAVMLRVRWSHVQSAILSAVCISGHGSRRPHPLQWHCER